MSDCGACTGETNIKLCHDHTTALEQNLAEVDDMVDNLGVSIARQDKGAARIGGGASGSKPPINLSAMERHDQLRAVLAGWATALEGNNIFTRVSTKNIASYLFTRIDNIRTVEWAYELLDELSTAMNAGRAACDRAADKISLGRCQTIYEGVRCPDEVTAIIGAAWGRCRTCGGTVDVITHQRAMIDMAWDITATLPAILRALKQAGHGSIPIARAEKWVKRESLVPVSPGRYTPRDVLAAYEQTPLGKKAKQAREDKARKIGTLSYAA